MAVLGLVIVALTFIPLFALITFLVAILGLFTGPGLEIGLRAFTGHAIALVPAALTAALTGRLEAARLIDLAGGLGRHQHAPIMFGMLQVILALHPVTGRLGIARQLQVFFVNMGGSATDLHVRSRRIKGPVGHMLRLTAAATARALLVVLTLSHGIRFNKPVRGGIWG